MYDSEGSNVKKNHHFLILLFSKTNNVYIYIYNLRLINGGIGFQVLKIFLVVHFSACKSYELIHFTDTIIT